MSSRLLALCPVLRESKADLLVTFSIHSSSDTITHSPEFSFEHMAQVYPSLYKNPIAVI